MEYCPTKVKNYELLKVFPEAKPIVVGKIKHHKQELDRLLGRKRTIRNEDFENNVDEITTEFRLSYYDWLIELHQSKLKTLEVILRSADTNTNKHTINIERAKEFPITSLLDFNRANKACCIFHDEKTPSLHYYKKTNTVYCWGCHKSGDSIEVAMAMWGIGFKEAVARLNV